jgi:hypothetical protein
MIDPAIDRPDEPFSYFSKPTDVIGVMDAPQGTLITPEGYLYTGFGELMFFTGNPAEPVNQRVKTLRRGFLPIVEYSFERHHVIYSIVMFAATLDGTPQGTLVNFIRVRIRNTTHDQRTAFFSVATRHQNEVNTEHGVGDNRFPRPATAKRLSGYSQSGEEFDPAWTYGFTNNAFVRDGKVMYLFPSDTKMKRMFTLKTFSFDNNNSLAERHLKVQPATPVGVVQYEITLRNGEERLLDFRMPYEPLPVNDPRAASLRAASFVEFLGRTERFWGDVYANGIDIFVPEREATETFKASLVYDLIARDKVGDDYIQNVNKFNYHAFWLRDASYIVRMYDISGYPKYARQALDFFARWQNPDGNFVSQKGQFDAWGQTLWAYGQHYRLTRDKEFAARVYPAVQKAVAWLKAARCTDPLRLMPVTTPGDNEHITGHVTGYNFDALAGLKNAIVLAEALGKDDDARDYRHEYDDYKNALLLALNHITSLTGGYIPPALDERPVLDTDLPFQVPERGNDWGNMESVYPEMILDPWDPMVTATLATTRAKYREGIMTYGGGLWLHSYLGMMNTETELIRGEQEKVIEDFYALLLHTSSTHAGFEHRIEPWGSRDFGLNLAPHGWFAAKLRILMRDMLVREQGNDLHLLSAVSPEWIRVGEQIIVRRAPTEFGELNYSIKFLRGKAELTIANRLTEMPRKIPLHIPWFMRVKSVRADGMPLVAQAGVVNLPSTVRRVEIGWTRSSLVKQLSYEHAVKDYKAEYKRRYERFLRTGESGR